MGFESWNRVIISKGPNEKIMFWQFWTGGISQSIKVIIPTRKINPTGRMKGSYLLVYYHFSIAIRLMFLNYFLYLLASNDRYLLLRLIFCLITQINAVNIISESIAMHYWKITQTCITYTPDELISPTRDTATQVTLLKTWQWNVWPLCPWLDPSWCCGCSTLYT